MTTSLRMKLCAQRGGRFLAPDPPQDGDQKRESCHADEEAAHLAGVRIEEDVTGDRHAGRDATDLSREANRPGVAARIRIALGAIRELAWSRQDVDHPMGHEPPLD